MTKPRSATWLLAALASLSLVGCQSAAPSAQAGAESPAAPDTSAPAAAVAASAPPFRAIGQEPSWLLQIDGAQAWLTTDFGTRVVTLPLQGYEEAGAVTRYTAADAQHRLSAEATRQVCRDTMSGMPHPYSVSVDFDEQRFTGCGGAPLSLLTEHEWVIEDLDGGGIIDRSRISLAFADDKQRAWGMASCNSFYAGFTLTGESLGFSQAAATMKACAPSLMAQEQKFFRILGGITAFDIDRTGALILSGTEGSMKAYPATPRPQ